MIKDGETYVITSNEWFYGSDGFQYRAAYGKCTIVKAEDALGFTPQRPSTNWFLQIGEGDRQVIIAGCQIHYAVKCATRPMPREGTRTDTDGEVLPFNRIWFTDEDLRDCINCGLKVIPPDTCSGLCPNCQ